MSSIITSPRTRPRQGTVAALLGDKYVETPSGIPTVKAPNPLKSISDYTFDRVQNSLSWVDQRLRSRNRTPTPISGKALLIYQELCCELLKASDKDHREYLIVTLIQFEKSMQGDKLLFDGSRDPKSQALQDDLLSHKRRQFDARYGDYLASICTKFRVKATTLNADDCHLISGPSRNWIATQEDIQVENDQLEEWKRDPAGKSRPLTPTSDAIYTVCREAGLIPARTLYGIREYAARNAAMHASWDDMIRDGKFTDLKTRLFEDLQDLPMIAPADNPEHEKWVSITIKSMIARWFLNSDIYPDNRENWGASPELIAYGDKLRGKLGAAEAVRAEEMKNIAEKAKASKEREAQDEELAHLTGAIAMANADELPDVTYSGVKDVKGKGKRDASSELDNERRKRNVNRLASFNKIRAMAHNVVDETAEYKAEYGSLKRPPPITPSPPRPFRKGSSGSPDGSPPLGLETELGL